jgi:ribosomal protein L35AE/L33A
MKLREALKKKNDLAKELVKLQQRVRSNNSTLQGNPVLYDVKAILAEHTALTEELIALKTRISKANLVVQEKIFRMSELKSQVIFYRSIDAKIGRVADYHGKYGSETVQFVCQLNATEIDAIVDVLENEISNLQDDLDFCNNTTEI